MNHPTGREEAECARGRRGEPPHLCSEQDVERPAHRDHHEQQQGTDDDPGEPATSGRLALLADRCGDGRGAGDERDATSDGGRLGDEADSHTVMLTAAGEQSAQLLRAA